MKTAIESTSLEAIRANVDTLNALININYIRIIEAEEAIENNRGVTATVGAILELREQLKEAQILVDAVLALSRTQKFRP